MTGAVLGIVVLLAFCGLFVWSVVCDRTFTRLRRPRRRPRELRGDWWSDFERQFRDYERRNAHRRPPTRHPQDWPRP